VLACRRSGNAGGKECHGDDAKHTRLDEMQAALFTSIRQSKAFEGSKGHTPCPTPFNGVAQVLEF
jgi:hypothetical protein